MSLPSVAILAVAGALAGLAIGRMAPRLAGENEAVRGGGNPWLRPDLLGALAFATLGLTLGNGFGQVRWFVFALLLVATIATDDRFLVVPDRLTFPGAFAGLTFSIGMPLDLFELPGNLTLMALAKITHPALVGLTVSVGGAAVGFFTLELLRVGMGAVAGREVMGQGDSKLLMLIGSFTGPLVAVLTIPVGLACALPLGLLERRSSRSEALPFGPALAIGGFVSMLAGGWLVGLLAPARQPLPPRALGMLSLILLVIAFVMLVRVRRRRDPEDSE